MVNQFDFLLPPFSYGIHLITANIVAKLPPLPEMGLLNIFIRHTSAAITINENADPSVRLDFEGFLNRLVPERQTWFTHTSEGPDDMPAHIKASLVGFSITVPISNGQLSLGTWQGIYLCEFRNRGGSRRLTVTIVE